MTTQVVSYAVSLGACVMPFPGITAWLPGDGNTTDEISGASALWRGTEAYPHGRCRASVLATATFQHIALTYDSATATISTHLNGQLVQSEPWTGSPDLACRR